MSTTQSQRPPYVVPLIGRILLAMSLCTTTGCLISHARKHVIRENERRRDVVFETPEVAERFHKVANDQSQRDAEGSSSSFGIPFLVGLSHASVPSQNAFYNDQVAQCDADCNGLLTAAEVDTYLEQR